MFCQNKTVAAFSCSNGLLFYMYKLLACSFLLHSAHMREIRVHCYAHKHAAGKHKHITRAHKTAQSTANKRSYDTAKLLRASHQAKGFTAHISSSNTRQVSIDIRHSTCQEQAVNKLNSCKLPNSIDEHLEKVNKTGNKGYNAENAHITEALTAFSPKRRSQNAGNAGQ